MKKILSTLILIYSAIMTTGAGYLGTLPNIDAEFQYLKEEVSDKTQAPFSVEELDEQNAKELKPIPRDNDDYVDIIIKKDKTSKYMNEVSKVVDILHKLRSCINNQQDIQKFNAIVSNFIDHVEHIRVEYQDKPERFFVSYSKLIALANEARDVATFRMQGRLNEKYFPYTSEDNIYTRENLDVKLTNLVNNVSDMIFIINNLE
jgi:hypothetical protein